MKTFIIVMALVALSGCESIGTMLKEKQYSLQINETPYSRQMFGYNTDHDYVGFMMTGTFGNVGRKHTHNGYCDHTFQNSLKKSTILR